MPLFQRLGHSAGPFAGLIATVLFLLATAGFGMALEGYGMARHPLTLLGAGGVQYALAFNLLAFVLPGLLGVWVVLQFMRRLPARASGLQRVGAQMLLLSTLAFIGIGLLPLDADDLTSRANQLHASAWMLWVVAFIPGALLVSLGARGQPGWSAVASLSAAAALAVLLGAFVLGMMMPAPLAQRLAFLAWLVWLAALLPLAPRRA